MRGCKTSEKGNLKVMKEEVMTTWSSREEERRPNQLEQLRIGVWTPRPEQQDRIRALNWAEVRVDVVAFKWSLVLQDSVTQRWPNPWGKTQIYSTKQTALCTYNKAKRQTGIFKIQVENQQWIPRITQIWGIHHFFMALWILCWEINNAKWKKLCLF